MASDGRVSITTDADIVLARQEGRRLASTLAFSPSDLTVIAAAISELARNIYAYARTGAIEFGFVEKHGRRGIQVVARDAGPGIADIEQAMQDGYSTSGSLGLGLPGVRRLVDEFELVSAPNEGTVVTFRKWAR